MKWLHPLALVATLAGIVYTEVLDLGDLKQYDSKLDALPDGLQSDSIWITQVDGGFNVILGHDIKAKVDGVLEGCDKPNDQCYQEIAKVLEDAFIQTDKHLESRQWLVVVGFIARVWKTVKRLKEAIAALSLAIWIANHQHGNDKGNFWPEVAASGAANLPDATPITVSAGGSAVATITQAPNPTITLERSVTPVVTAVTSAVDGFDKGDLAVILDKGLADRLTEFMERTKDCQAGSDFDQQHSATPRKRAGGGTYGQALCASQAVMGGVQVDGPWNDLLLLNPAGVHFQFAQAAGPAMDAANQFADFVHTYAPLMAVPTELVDQLATYVFALAIDAIVESIPLGERNRIKATMVTTSASPTGTSAPGCPDKESGEHRNCECTLLLYPAVDTASPEQQKSLLSFKELLGKASTPDPRPECPIVVTDIPAAVFSSEKMNIHNHFCEGWLKHKKSTMTVDSKGANVLPEPHLGTVTKRTPPPNAGSYSDFRFDLSFTPSEHGGESGIYMYEKGSYDVGCGTYDYRIYNPFIKLVEFPRSCYKQEEVPPLKGDVHGGSVKWGTLGPCAGSGRPENIIKKDDKSTFIQKLSWDGKVPYQYNIWWQEGCTLVGNAPTSAYAPDPLMQGRDAGATKCQDTLYLNWEKCNNGGIGGYVQLGCLVFEFKASEILRTF
ncbi:hypothetical protein GE09DRAFT_1248586 [Coniochaeta sp. 2T2.1]|nr:hypothetical protein GE09DRAFT_1248586 [Coniochaeta sp. 2T2.1]